MFRFNLQLFGEGLQIPGIDEDIVKEIAGELDTEDKDDGGAEETGSAEADSDNKQVAGDDNGGAEETTQQQEGESEGEDDEELPEGTNIPYPRFKSVNEKRKAEEAGRKAAEAKVKELEAQLAALKGTAATAPPAPAANVPFKQPQAQATQQQPAPAQQQPGGDGEFTPQQIERIAQMAIARAKAKLNLSDDDVANLDYADKPETKVAYNNIVAEEMRNIRSEVQQYLAREAAFNKQISETAQEFEALNNKLGAYEDAQERWDFIGFKHFDTLPQRRQQVLKEAFARLQNRHGTYQDMDMINDYFESANKLYEQKRAEAAGTASAFARTQQKINSVKNLPKAPSVNGGTGADKVLTVSRLQELLATPGGWDKLTEQEQKMVLQGKIR